MFVVKRDITLRVVLVTTNTYTKDCSTERDLPRQLEVEALRAAGIRDVLERVPQRSELLDGSVERLLQLVLRVDRVVEALRVLVPEAVEHGRVGESVGVLDEGLEIQHDVLVGETLLTNVVQSRLDS